MPDSPAIAFVTLGCPKNEVDSDRMAAAIGGSGYRVVGDPDDADVVVLNTCSFIQAATEESIAEALALAGEWRPARKGRKLVVAGCMVSRYGDELAEAMPEADAFLPVADEASLAAVLGRLTGTPVRAGEHAGAHVARTVPGPTAYLKVSEGCDRKCAYCTIPSIRGRFASAPPAEVLTEAQWLIGAGARELVLVGQDIASYGTDLAEDVDLAGLVRSLDGLEGDFRIRLMYVQPDGVTDALLQVMADSAHVCHYLDIPLQHAAAGVLDAMGRTGSPSAHLELLARIRQVMPDVVLRTTVMAGFPGESEADATALEQFLGEAGFDFVGVFAYSPEDGTPAAEMADQVPDDVRAERAQRFRDAADAAGFARAEALIGSVQQVLVEGMEEGELVGRTAGQAPEVDGLVVLGFDAPVGEFVKVVITGAAGYDLMGESR